MSSEETLTHKKKVRTTHRASASRLLSQAESLLENSRIDLDALALLQTNLSAKLTTLEAPIATHRDASPPPSSNLSVATHCDASSPHTQSPDHSPSAHSVMGETVSSSSKVKLPKISLPRFDGDPVMWTTFWDSYQSTIHSNTGISDIDKFNYLRSLLDHAALDAIAGLTVSTTNYQQVVEILTKRFGNKHVIISKHMDALMTLELSLQTGTSRIYVES